MSNRLQPESSQQYQPRTFKLSLLALCSLPRRLCSPPTPTVGKVRSFSVTPIYDVQLEDILDRKHLPPLGLKDFEEWLLYVEQCPENLYFILWLREYSARYNRWIASTERPRNAVGEYRLPWPAHSCPSLGMFYARAKQTFFTPNSDYELDVPSDILSPFHTSNYGPQAHPDPVIFAEVAAEIHKMLKASLERFVLAAYTNVGTNRAICGIAGGISIALLGAAVPMIYNSLHGQSRWLRLIALPGMWLGLTVLIASLNGVCMMIFIFGDLRQLRKFELSRPPISRPQRLHWPRRPPTNSPPLPMLRPPLTRPPIIPASQAPKPPPPARVRTLSQATTSVSHDGSDSTTTCAGSLTSADGPNGVGNLIHISPAFFDERPAPEGPATTPHSPTYAFPSRTTPPLPLSSPTGQHGEPDAAELLANTASFIHPYDSCTDDEESCSPHAEYERGRSRRASPQSRQPVTAFDFDALPPAPRRGGRSRLRAYIPPPREQGAPRNPTLGSRFTPKALLLRAQYECGAKYFSTTSLDRPLQDRDTEKGDAGDEGEKKPLPPAPCTIDDDDDEQKKRVRVRYRLIRAVPAFSPLTRVLSPVISRAQWEIVVRSAACALLISWVVLGCFLAVPVNMR